MAFSIWFLFLFLVRVDGPPLFTCSLRDVLHHFDIPGYPQKPGHLSPGVTLRGKCHIGYLPREQFLLECKEVDGRPVLSAIPCQPVTCDLPQDKDSRLITIEHGSDTTGDMTYGYGDKYKPVCTDGYEYKGSQLTCEENGQFSGDLGTCERVTCPPPYAIGPEGTSVVNATGDKFGDIVYLRQNRGYECSGLKNLMCEANGQWTDAANITCKFLHGEEQSTPSSDKPDTNNDTSASMVGVFFSGVVTTLAFVGLGWFVWYYKYRGQSSCMCYNKDEEMSIIEQVDTGNLAEQDKYKSLTKDEPQKEEDDETDTMSLQDISEKTADTEQEKPLLTDVTGKKEPSMEEGEDETDATSGPPSAFISEDSNVIELSDDVKLSGMLVACDDAEQAN